MKRLLVRWIFKIGVFLVYPFIYISRKRKSKEYALKYSSIVDGFTNVIVHNPVTEERAQYLAKICAACKYSKYSKTLNKIVVDNQTKTVRGLYCETCGCSISAKIRSKGDFCPRGKW